jgi:hypothetical protein
MFRMAGQHVSAPFAGFIQFALPPARRSACVLVDVSADVPAAVLRESWELLPVVRRSRGVSAAATASWVWACGQGVSRTEESRGAQKHTPTETRRLLLGFALAAARMRVSVRMAGARESSSNAAGVNVWRRHLQATHDLIHLYVY